MHSYRLVQTTFITYQMNKYIIFCICLIALVSGNCNDPCYKSSQDTGCGVDPLRPDIDAYTFHMSVHPHLDAYWIFTFDDYYNPSPNNGAVRGYFAQNVFHSVKEIFNTALATLNQSKKWREQHGQVHQKAHRSFMNSEMGFFKHWYTTQLNAEQKKTLKEILGTRFWEILGGGFVEHDEAGAYYDDIIDNFQIGLHWLKQEFNYLPKVAISADSFGHSQSNAAILSQLGIEGSLVERSDEHILTKNKTEFIWKAKSANNRTYGVIPTVIRWAIHGFQDQFRQSGKGMSFCSTKANYIQNLKRQNIFLKRLFNSSHILRYFGHDFQRFTEYSYEVIEDMMKKFSKQKCNKVIATYSNPTEYFERTLQQVYGKKVREFQFREEDIMPIWDYDSGLYWTGYYTTDPYHKKIYKDAGRLAQLSRKLFTRTYLQNPNSKENTDAYDILERFQENVAYLQHHDGVTGTSKYTVMDHYEKLVVGLSKELETKLIRKAFDANFVSTQKSSLVFSCYLDQECTIPKTQADEIQLKIFNSGGLRKEQIKINLLHAVYYEALDCPYEVVCMCYDLPCACTLYLYPELSTFNEVILRRTKEPQKPYLLKQKLVSNFIDVSNSAIIVSLDSKNYQISYKKVPAEATPRTYQHLNRQGRFNYRSFMIRSGKYALGNNPNKIETLSDTKEYSFIQTPTISIAVVNWNRQGLKTVVTFNNTDRSVFKVDTLFSAQLPHNMDYYLSIKTPIKNKNEFYTDSNGWLVVKRTLFHHEDYQAHFDPAKFDDIDGNSYPINAFVYIQDESGKVAVNVDRPEGVIVYREGDIWLNFDRLTSDDGKWVYETTYRSEYMKYSHVVSVQKPSEYKERMVQKQRDEGLYLQGDSFHSKQYPKQNSGSEIRKQWSELSNLNNIKFNVKTWNDSTLLLRVHNLHDQKSQKLTLFSKGTQPNTITSVFLTSYYGKQLIGDKIQEMSLGGNMKYQDFINNKWNLHHFTNLSGEYQMFSKEFAENITLRPLQIRTFLISKPRFSNTTCQNASMLQYSGVKQHYSLDLNKKFHTVPKNVLEEKAKNYLLKEQHCDPNWNNETIVDQLPPHYDYIQSPNSLSYRYNTSSTTGSKEQPKPDPKPKPETKPDTPATTKQPTTTTKPKPSQPTKSTDPNSIQYITEQVNNRILLTPAQKKIYIAHRMLNPEMLENCVR